MAPAHFRVLTPDNLVSYDTFALAERQPSGLRRDCVLLVNQSDGSLLVAHKTRLIVVEPSRPSSPAKAAKSVCLSCGRVAGVVDDEVACPHHGGGSCQMLHPLQ